MSSFNPLRAVATRLNSTPVYELPHLVGYLATSILSASSFFQSSTTGSDSSVVLHKLRTKTSALLQDRTPEGRFAGIVITKALVEAGGLSVLSESGSLVRNLISCLNKPDPWEAKSICVSVITRTYLLTSEHQALVREITTPTLPAFISASLSAIKPAVSTYEGKSSQVLSPLLHSVLSSWHVLIKHFASTLRPNISSIKAICLSLVSDGTCEAQVQRAANKVLARLHFCAPRNTIAVEWGQMCSQAIEAAQDTADLVFRAVVEDWASATSRTSKLTRKQRTATTPATSTADVLGLDKWSGISEGCQRLTAQVRLIGALLTSLQVQEMSMPLTAIFDLTSRLSAVTPPTSRFALRANEEITRDEREQLWLNIPRVHSEVLRLFEDVARTFGRALYPVAAVLRSQIWDIFDSQSNDHFIRDASYQLMAVLLSRQLFETAKADSSNLKRLISLCCKDLMDPAGQASDVKLAVNGEAGVKKNSSNLSLSWDNTKADKRTSALPDHPPLYASAHDLLPQLISHISFDIATGGRTLRAQLDSNAILVNHHEAMLASVLNPVRPRADTTTGQIAPPNPSLLPFLARELNNPDCKSDLESLSTEALLRPRMPVIVSAGDAATFDEAPGDVAEDEQEDAVMDQAEGLPIEPNFNGGIAKGGQAGSIDTFPNLNGIETAHSDMQTLANTQKRDFTALLEESTDAQLAASAKSNEKPESQMHDSDQLHDPPFAKRQRVDAADISIPVSLPGWEQDPGPPEAAAAEIADTSFPLASTTKESTGAVNVTAATTEAKGKERAKYEDDSDSDSSIPPIDATLVGFSDSEDEDEALT